MTGLEEPYVASSDRVVVVLAKATNILQLDMASSVVAAVAVVVGSFVAVVVAADVGDVSCGEYADIVGCCCCCCCYCCYID